MTRPTQSTALRNPNPEADDIGRKIYQAMLERRVLMLSMENIRLRACLERATGTPWDSQNIADYTSEQMDEMVIRDLMQGLRMTMKDARALVGQNKAMANPSQKEPPDPLP